MPHCQNTHRPQGRVMPGSGLCQPGRCLESPSSLSKPSKSSKDHVPGEHQGKGRAGGGASGRRAVGGAGPRDPGKSDGTRTHWRSEEGPSFRREEAEATAGCPVQPGGRLHPFSLQTPKVKPQRQRPFLRAAQRGSSEDRRESCPLAATTPAPISNEGAVSPTPASGAAAPKVGSATPRGTHAHLGRPGAQQAR